MDTVMQRIDSGQVAWRRVALAAGLGLCALAPWLAVPERADDEPPVEVRVETGAVYVDGARVLAADLYAHLQEVHAFTPARGLLVRMGPGARFGSGVKGLLHDCEQMGFVQVRLQTR